MPVSFWVRRKYAHLRCLMRGNAWSKRNAGFAAIRRLQNGLITVPVGANETGAKWFYGASAPKAELVVRQFVFDRYGGVRLNHALFEHLGCKASIDAGMPATWRAYLIDKGWPVNRLASLFAWQIIVGLRFAHGVFCLNKLCLKLAFAKKMASVPLPYAYFEGLSFANLPIQSADGPSYDICTFYAQWPARYPNVRAICHDVARAAECMTDGLRVNYLPPAYELAGGLGNAFKLAWWGGWATLFAALQMLLGRWHWALMLGEAAKAKAVRLVPAGNLAVEYLFHASRTIYRPLWTYDVEQVGAKITLYFYSTTVQPKLKQGYESQRFEWGPNTWPRFLVWDRYQEERIRKELGNTVEVLQAGPVCFADSNKLVPDLPSNSIAIFDIQPHRPSAHLGISTLADCQADHPDFYHRFLIDVTDVLKECGALAVLKTKRKIGMRGDKRYGCILSRLETSEGVRILDPEISAMRVAANCCAGISAPFTSTAIYVQSLGKPSVYYDPFGWIQPDDSGAHGIPILCGKEALRAWVVQVLAIAAAER